MKKNDGNQRKQKQKLESHSDETKAKIYAKKENYATIENSEC